jgi:hypothetical protein
MYAGKYLIATLFPFVFGTLPVLMIPVPLGCVIANTFVPLGLAYS